MIIRIFFTLMLSLVFTATTVYTFLNFKGLENAFELIYEFALPLDNYYAFLALLVINCFLLLLHIFNFRGRAENPKINLSCIFLHNSLFLTLGSIVCLHHHRNEFFNLVNKHWHGVEHWAIGAFVATLVMNVFTLLLCSTNRTTVQINLKCYSPNGESNTKELVRI